MDLVLWILLVHVVPNLSLAVTKVSLDELISSPAKFCHELKSHGYAIVQCNLKRREAALNWLESNRHDQAANVLETEFSPGLARCQDVAFPRPLRRLDVVAKEEENPVTAVAWELHHVAIQCLRAIAEHEQLPLEDLVSLEALDEAKEPSFLRANLYNSKDGGAGPCWHVDLGLLTVMPVGSWPAMMASPFHETVKTAFLEEMLDADRDVMVFGGTALALASAGLYLALVHGVSAARLNRRGLRISLPYFLRVRRGGIIQQPRASNDRLACLYPAAVQPGDAEAPMLDLLRFHRDFYGKLCTRGQVVPLEELARDPALEQRIRNFYTDSQV